MVNVDEGIRQVNGGTPLRESLALKAGTVPLSGDTTHMLLERLRREVDDPGAQEALLDRIRTHAFVVGQEVIA